MQGRIDEQQQRIDSMSYKITIGEQMHPSEVVRLEHQRKVFTDLIKILAYRAENVMLGQVQLSKTRDLEESRVFLQTVFKTPADLIPLHHENKLIVRFHSTAQPRFNRALEILCQRATERRCTYPGTDLIMVYEAKKLHEEIN